MFLSINLSILDFKSGLDRYNLKDRRTINLSILDFKFFNPNKIYREQKL